MADISFRPFVLGDHPRVRDIFIAWNRHITPPGKEAVFDRYIRRALAEEIDRIPDYYGRPGFGFWVAEVDGQVAGMGGLEPLDDGSIEVRRMYVAEEFRRNGIGRRLLRYLEEQAREQGYPRIVLSTSALQPQAKALYETAGYILTREESAEAQTTRAAGGGLLRYYFEKNF